MLCYIIVKFLVKVGGRNLKSRLGYQQSLGRPWLYFTTFLNEYLYSLLNYILNECCSYTLHFAWHLAFLQQQRCDTSYYRALEVLYLLCYALMPIQTAWFSKSPSHRCFHTARLSGAAFSYIARWITDRSRYLACQIFHGRLWFSQIASLIIHTVWMLLVWSSTDLPQISGNCWRFHKTSRWVKIGAEIVRCELDITLPNLSTRLLYVNMSRDRPIYRFTYIFPDI